MKLAGSLHHALASTRVWDRSPPAACTGGLLLFPVAALHRISHIRCAPPRAAFTPSSRGPPAGGFTFPAETLNSAALLCALLLGRLRWCHRESARSCECTQAGVHRCLESG